MTRKIIFFLPLFEYAQQHVYWKRIWIYCWVLENCVIIFCYYCFIWWRWWEGNSEPLLCLPKYPPLLLHQLVNLVILLHPPLQTTAHCLTPMRMAFVSDLRDKFYFVIKIFIIINFPVIPRHHCRNGLFTWERLECRGWDLRGKVNPHGDGLFSLEFAAHF